MLGPCAPSTCIRHVGHIPCTLGLGPSGLSTQAATQEWGGPLRGAHRVAPLYMLLYTCSSLISSLLARPPPTAISPHPGPRRQMVRLKANGRAQRRLSGERLVCKHLVSFIEFIIIIPLIIMHLVYASPHHYSCTFIPSHRSRPSSSSRGAPRRRHLRSI